ncbi:hypothetical protein E1287_37595 [Actinomadura sp. KC06]|uniref:hypothetical protein n=1 Tax=Actinomadura sp. KC06 TaxID=2530369 RepID=UPI001052915E|nr:hypothetical protein [Actinomadura sp. KC06]TDD25049.1 hypothetical protein E1287_37595 [Actinomadura sp. KC06]
MATTNVPYSNLVPNGSLASPAGTAITSGAGNGGQITAARPELTVIRLSNASGGAGTATVKAGDYPPALAAGQGDFTTGSIANGATVYLGPFESGRFIQSDGSMIVESSVALTMTAFKVPRNT